LPPALEIDMLPGEADIDKSAQWEEAMCNRLLLRLLACFALAVVSPMIPTNAMAQPPAVPPPAPIMPPSLPPSQVVDLMTAEGSAAFGAQWKVSDVKIVEVPAIQGALPQHKTTYNIEPRAGESGFDDSKWPTIEAKDLSVRRSGGHVAFMWYRTMLTIPAKIGAFDTADAQVVLQVLVDDYAEVWINGQMPRRAGFPSPATIQGFNMPNRVMLSTKASAGDKFQVAIFGINGPISVAPANTVWFREAKVQLYK
jgi:gluconolactonase